MTVTLFVDDGGGFDVVDRSRPSIDADGGFDTTFSRPGAGHTCKVVVRFGGSEGRMPSSAKKTFDC